MKKNKKIVITCLTAMILAISSVVTYAYFTAKTQKTNNIILGYNKIELKENYIPPLMMDKGISFVKEPYVQNTGDVDCYVRLKSVVSDSRIEEYLTINYNDEDFTYNEQDGYWYYNKAINPGEVTEKLFTTVSIAQNADDIVLDGFDIYVYAESIQTVGGKTMNEVWSN